MKRLATILIISILIISCVERPAPPPVPDVVYRKITAPEAAMMMMMIKDHVLLDARPTEYFDVEKIPGAINIPHTDIYTKIEDAVPDKDALILVYCQVGARAFLAATSLIGLGYTNVYDFGGIVDWPFGVETNR
jgi:rhodanese-related sulfurtransferase